MARIGGTSPISTCPDPNSCHAAFCVCKRFPSAKSNGFSNSTYETNDKRSLAQHLKASPSPWVINQKKLCKINVPTRPQANAGIKNPGQSHREKLQIPRIPISAEITQTGKVTKWAEITIHHLGNLTFIGWGEPDNRSPSEPPTPEWQCMVGGPCSRIGWCQLVCLRLSVEIPIEKSAFTYHPPQTLRHP